jgi:putative endonuclease
MTSFKRGSFVRCHSPEKGNPKVLSFIMFKPTHQYFVYILASKKNGVLYIGVTNDLERRMIEHKNKFVKSFASRYNVDKLVYFEQYSNINKAIKREKRLKKWNRQWKIDLIEEENPKWIDLSEEWEIKLNENKGL